MLDDVLSVESLDDERRGLFDRLLPSAAATSRVGREDVHPLSFAQERLWFAERYQGASTLFTFPSAIRIEGDLDLRAFTKGFAEVVRRHRVLTARFPAQDGVPRQVFDDRFECTMPVVSLENIPQDRREQVVAEMKSDEAARVFDTERGPLFCVTVLRLEERCHVVLMNMHHLVSDGWSGGIFIRDFSAVYRALLDGSGEQIAAAPLQYSDFVYWQRERLAGPASEVMAEYWRRQLADLQPLGLPLDFARSVESGHAGDRVILPIEPVIVDRLRNLASTHGSTLFMALLAAFKVLLWRWCDQTDIVVGTSVACRPRSELEEVIGLFVNQLALRTDLGGNPSFVELLGRVKDVTTAAFEHQELPFDHVVAQVPHERHASIHPLFQVMFLLHNFPRREFGGGGGLSVREEPVMSRSSRFDLCLTIEGEGDALEAHMIYRAALFRRSTIVDLARAFNGLLRRVHEQCEAPISRLKVFDHEEQQPMTAQNASTRPKRSGRFKRGRRRAVNLAAIEPVKKTPMDEGKTRPLLIEPAVTGVSLAEWAMANQALLEQASLRRGAILFRGFETNTVPRFEKAVNGICPELFADYGDLPKETEGQKVYKSTPYPEDRRILFHNESSHMHRWPSYQFFGAMVVAEQGGNTPIADCREVFRHLTPEITRSLAQRGLLYVRNFMDGLDVRWQDFFKTDSREVVEERCRRWNAEYEWLDGGGLRIRQRARAVIAHPETGDASFFGQIQLHHINYMERNERESLLALFGKAQLPRNVYYGDGEDIEPEVLESIDEAYEAVALSFPWQRGDLLMLDNMLIAHARDPYSGPRKIVVGMGRMTEGASVPGVAADAWD